MLNFTVELLTHTCAVIVSDYVDGVRVDVRVTHYLTEVVRDAALVALRADRAARGSIESVVA